MSFSHILILVIIAVIVVPPDKLPELARQVARFFNEIRRTTGGLWNEIKKDVVYKPADVVKETPPKSDSLPSEENKNHES